MIHKITLNRSLWGLVQREREGGREKREEGRKKTVNVKKKRWSQNYGLKLAAFFFLSFFFQSLESSNLVECNQIIPHGFHLILLEKNLQKFLSFICSSKIFCCCCCCWTKEEEGLHSMHHTQKKKKKKKKKKKMNKWNVIETKSCLLQRR